jgi:hypothetical protein
LFLLNPLPNNPFVQQHASNHTFTMLSDVTTRYFIVIEACFVIVSFALAFFNYFTELAWRKAKEDLGSVCGRETAMGYFVAKRPTALDYLRRKTTGVPEVPSIADLIKAGDGGLYTSSMFDYISPSYAEVCWVRLYKQFFNEMALFPQGPQGRTADARKSSGIANIWAKADVCAEPVSRSDLVSCILPLVPYISLQGGRLVPTKNKYPSCFLIFKEIRPLWILEGKPCIETSREELAGLALVLGITFKLNNHSSSMCGTGPFGIHFEGERNKLQWRLRLDHQNRQPDHGRTTGHGYLTLFAKHMACECLPFGRTQETRRVLSVYIDKDTWNSIRNNRKVFLKRICVPVPEPLKYLSRLPAADAPYFFYNQKAEILGDSSVPWVEAVVGIAFGGLVPQAGENLVRAVAFTITGREELIPRSNTGAYTFLLPYAIQLLIKEVHKRSPDRNHFGSIGNDFPETDSSPSTSRHAGALFARYMTLLERITAIYAERPEPEASQSEASQSGAPQPGVPQPEASQSGAPQSGVPQSRVPQPEASQSGAPQSGAPQSRVTQPEASQSGAPQPGVPQPEAPQSGAPQPWIRVISEGTTKTVYISSCEAVSAAYEAARAGQVSRYAVWKQQRTIELLASKVHDNKLPLSKQDCADVCLAIITAWTYRVHVLEPISLKEFFDLPAMSALGVYYQNPSKVKIIAS